MSRATSRILALLLSALVATGVQVAFAPTPAEAKVWKVPANDLSLDPLVKLNEYETRVVNLINKKRKARDLEPVKYFQGCLDNMAEKWSAHLLDIGELVHRDQQKVLKACDLNWTGETLASGTLMSPTDTVKAWMNSKPHRLVIMKPRATLAGVGARITLLGKVYCVLNFGDKD